MNANAVSTKKLSAVSDLIRLPKQQGTLLVLWPTLWSLFIASAGAPGAKLLVIFVLGTFLMRSAGCAINDIADRGFDPHVERTRTRPLANGRLNVREALLVFVTLSALAFALVLFLNTLTVLLSVAGILLASLYPFVKRVSHFPQVVLGMAFGWGAVMAWSAATGGLGPVPLLIFTANIFWSTAYDTIYALMDIDDDLKIGVKSTAIFFGKKVYFALALLYLLAAAFLMGAGYAAGMGSIYYSGVAVSLGAFLWIVARLKKNPTRETAFRGFIGNAVIGGFILVFILIDLNM